MKTFLACLVLLYAMLPISSNAAPLALHADGNLLKSADGKAVRLQGVCIASLEWSNLGDQIMKSMDVAVTDWNAKIIRLPLAEDRWFGLAQYQNDGGSGYRDLVSSIVKKLSAKGVYVILDLHWSNTGVWGQRLGQQNMPGVNSQVFWVAVAERFANNPAVFFGLYNEPHDVSWDVWRNGGEVTQDDKGTKYTYHTIGFQKLIELVRNTGAKNLLVIGGLDWAYDLTGILDKPLIDKTGNGIMYDSHIYPWKSEWEAKVGAAAAKYPVLLGEVGCEPDPKQEDPMTWAPKILAFIEKHQLNWTAWCFHPGASPRLLKSFDTYEPTPYWGVFVKKALTGK